VDAVTLLPKSISTSALALGGSASRSSLVFPDAGIWHAACHKVLRRIPVLRCAMRRDLEALESVLTALAREHEALMQERRELLQRWKREAANELHFLRAFRAMLDRSDEREQDE
jgi:hypothetical protein